MDDSPLPRIELPGDIADPLERARAFAEANACENVSLEQLAEVAGLSAYHFSRQFAARFGVSPIAFVREQRMASAAVRLSGKTAPTLVELAFDLGFESQEGFTRAFKRAHGVSPGRYRRSPGALKETAMITTRSSLTMSAAPVARAGFRVAGFSKVIGESNRHEIPTLWPRLMQHLPLDGQTGDDASFGVCIPTEGQDGCFRYLAGVPIADGAPAPEGMEVIDVPAQSYLVFRQDTDGSDLHPQMQAAAKEIWGERAPNSGYKLAMGPDLEAYPPDFRPDAPSYVEWWIPVVA
jgi:AraC family transcriptional regulator